MKKIKYLLLAFLPFFSACSTPLSYEKYSGTEDDPYLIYSVADFLDIGGRLIHEQNNFTNKHFKLMNDLDFKGISYTPIGATMTNYFNGTFDGNNHTIKNISINDYHLYNGIFGVVGPEGSILNLNVGNFKKKDTTLDVSYTGGIAGFTFYGGIINNCHTSGSIESAYYPTDEYYFYSYSGGIVGKGYNYILNCSSSMNITSDVVGGIIGSASNYTINNCLYSNATINSNKVVGGIVGQVINSTYYDFYVQNSTVNNVTINSNYVCGGIVGTIDGQLKIDNCQSNANIISNNRPTFWGGGIVGANTYKGSVTKKLINIKNCISLCNFDVTVKDSESKIYIAPFIPYDNSSIEFSVYKGYMNLKHGKYWSYNQKANYKTIAIFTDKTNIDVINEERNGYILSSSKDNEIIADCLNYNIKWLNFNSLITLKNEEEIFANLNGRGTEGDPYLISNFEELSYIYISDQVKHFKLTNDIDANNYTLSDFKVIKETSSFILDGDNYSVKNLSLLNKNKYSSTLFTNLNNCIIKNINFNNLNINYDENIFNKNVYIFEELNNSEINNVKIDINLNYLGESLQTNQTFLYKKINSSNLINLDIDLNYSNNYDVYLQLFADVYEDCIIENFNIDINSYNYTFVDIITTSNSSCVFSNNRLNIYNATSLRVEEKEYGSSSINFHMDVYYNNELYFQQ